MGNAAYRRLDGETISIPHQHAEDLRAHCCPRKNLCECLEQHSWGCLRTFVVHCEKPNLPKHARQSHLAGPSYLCAVILPQLQLTLEGFNNPAVARTLADAADLELAHMTDHRLQERVQVLFSDVPVNGISVNMADSESDLSRLD